MGTWNNLPPSTGGEQNVAWGSAPVTNVASGANQTESVIVPYVDVVHYNIETSGSGIDAWELRDSRGSVVASGTSGTGTTGTDLTVNSEIAEVYVDNSSNSANAFDHRLEYPLAQSHDHSI